MILFLLFVVLLVLGIVYFVKSKKNNEPNDKAKKTLLASLVFFVLFAIRCVSVDAFAMLGSIVFLVGIAYFVYCLFKKQPKKKALCMILAGFFIVGYAGCISDSKPTESSPKVSTVEKVKKVEKVEVADLSGTDAQAWCDQNGFKLSKEEDFSDSVAQGGFISQSPQADTHITPCTSCPQSGNCRRGFLRLTYWQTEVPVHRLSPLHLPEIRSLPIFFLCSLRFPALEMQQLC